MKPVHEFTAEGQFPVRVFQHGPDDFDVLYGSERKAHLNYVDAARVYGQCVFHALACAGQLDNRMRREARSQRREALDD